jgi:chromosomal replication initiation ATPase DnaA
MSGQEAEQLVLDLGQRPALGAADFIVSASNRAAVALIDAYPQWREPVVALIGPEGAGKSHLVHVWQLRSDAFIVPARELGDAVIAEHAKRRAVVVEDIDRDLSGEHAVFHLLNQVKDLGGHVLITARMPPGAWQIVMPDLRSRVRALPVVPIGEPDEALLRAVLVKLLADRQLVATPAAVAHLARHLDRSMAKVLKVIAAIDRRVWQGKQAVTRDLVREVVAEVDGAAGEAD